MIIDLVFHVLIIVYLALGVKFGLEVKKEAANQATVEESAPSEDAPITDVSADAQRTVSVTRKKAFTGCAVPFICYVNGKEVCRLKNGATEQFQVPCSAFELGASISNGMAGGSVTVPAGTEDTAYQLSIKMGAFTNTLVFTHMNEINK